MKLHIVKDKLIALFFQPRVFIAIITYMSYLSWRNTSYPDHSRNVLMFSLVAGILRIIKAGVTSSSISSLLFLLKTGVLADALFVLKDMWLFGFLLSIASTAWLISGQLDSN